MNIDKSFMGRKRGIGMEYTRIGTALQRSHHLHFLIHQCSTNHLIPARLPQTQPAKNYPVVENLFWRENIDPFIPGQRLSRTGNV